MNDGARVLIPSDFKQLAGLLNSSANSSVRSSTSSQQHTLQLDLMAEEWEGVVLGLTAAATSAASELNALAAAAAGDGVMMEVEGEGVVREGAWAQLRFAAHAAVLLRALGLIRDPKLVDEDEQETVAR